MYRSLIYFILFIQRKSKVFYFTILLGLLSIYYLTEGIIIIQTSDDVLFEGLLLPLENNGLKSFLAHISIHYMFLMIFLIGIISTNMNTFFSSNFISQYLIMFPNRHKLLLTSLLVNTLVIFIAFLAYLSAIIFYHFIVNQVNLFTLFTISWTNFIYFYYIISLIFFINLYSINNSYGILISMILLIVVPILTTVLAIIEVNGNVFNYLIINRDIFSPFIPEYFSNSLKSAMGLESLATQFHLVMYSLIFNLISDLKLKNKVF